MLAKKNKKSDDLNELANNVRVALEALFATLKKFDYDNKTIATAVLIVAQEKIFQAVNEDNKINENSKIEYSSDLIYENLIILRRIMKNWKKETDDIVSEVDSIIH